MSITPNTSQWWGPGLASFGHSGTGDISTKTDGDQVQVWSVYFRFSREWRARTRKYKVFDSLTPRVQKLNLLRSSFRALFIKLEGFHISNPKPVVNFEKFLQQKCHQLANLESIYGLIDTDWPRPSSSGTPKSLRVSSRMILEACELFRRDVSDNVRHPWNDVQLYATW